MSNDDYEGKRQKAKGQSDGLDRLPPHATEAEQGVLGCCLLAPREALDICVSKFKGRAEVFYDLRHQTIFHVLAEMHEKQEAIDLITVRQRLKDRNILGECGGFEYLSSVIDMVPSAANIDYYLEILLEKSKLRRLGAICAEASLRIYTHEGEADQLLDEVERDISKLTEQETETAEEHIKETLWRVGEKIANEHYLRGTQQMSGLPVGPLGWYLDKIIGGIGTDWYVVLAGRPGSGKTSLAMNVVEYLATDYEWKEPTGKMLKGADDKEYPETIARKGIPICVFSLEMSKESLVSRLLFKRAGVDMAQWRQGFAPKDFEEKITVACAQLAKANIWIDDVAGQGIAQIAAKARRMVKQHGIMLFVLDYVQLMKSEDDGYNSNRLREMEKISAKVVVLKKQLKVPWIVLAQMNRNIETSERERKPLMSDLKDCGALEQDADLVLMTYRTPRHEVEKYPVDRNKERVKDEDGEVILSDAEIIKAVAKKQAWAWSEIPYRVDIVVPKHRNGPTGEAKLIFQNNLCAFDDWHLFKARHGFEKLKQGERAGALGLPSNEELGMEGDGGR